MAPLGDRGRRIALGGLLSVAVVLTLLSTATAQTPLGRVTMAHGHAGLIRDGMARTITLGTEVVEGDRVVTGERAMVSIGAEGGAVLTLGHATDLTVSTSVRDRDGHRLDLSLSRGSLRAALAPGAQWRALTIATPAATARARTGTMVVAADLFAASVYSLDTRVTVRTAAAAPSDSLTDSLALLGPGMGVDLRQGDRAARPMPWSEATATPLLARTDPH